MAGTSVPVDLSLMEVRHSCRHKTKHVPRRLPKFFRMYPCKYSCVLTSLPRDTVNLESEQIQLIHFGFDETLSGPTQTNFYLIKNDIVEENTSACKQNRSEEQTQKQISKHVEMCTITIHVLQFKLFLNSFSIHKLFEGEPSKIGTRQ